MALSFFFSLPFLPRMLSKASGDKGRESDRLGASPLFSPFCLKGLDRDDEQGEPPFFLFWASLGVGGDSGLTFLYFFLFSSSRPRAI